MTSSMSTESKPHSSDHSEHDQHDHAHHHASMDTSASRWRVLIAFLLISSFMVVEVIGGLISGSLALLADAAHMLTDAGALALAWLGYKLSEMPADPMRSYGWGRFKVLAAFVNALALIVLAIWISVEAVSRLLDPQPVIGELLLGVAMTGLLVNIIVFAILHSGDHDDLNMQGALWHVAGDLLGSIAAIAAAGIILTTGWMPIDPILSMVVALIILVGGIRLTRKSGHILIEGVPPGLSPEAIKSDLETHLAGAQRIDHIHAWALNESKHLVTLDILAAPGVDAETIRRAAKQRLKTAFGINHATVEIIASPDDSRG